MDVQPITGTRAEPCACSATKPKQAAPIARTDSAEISDLSKLRRIEERIRAKYYSNPAVIDQIAAAVWAVI